jgi:hypothetical protein
MRSIQDRFGTLNPPRNRPGFHPKNRIEGKKMVSQYGGCECSDAKKNVGKTVTTGMGQLSDGTPQEKELIHAKSTNPSPTPTVASNGFMRPLYPSRTFESNYERHNCC